MLDYTRFHRLLEGGGRGVISTPPPTFPSPLSYLCLVSHDIRHPCTLVPQPAAHIHLDRLTFQLQAQTRSRQNKKIQENLHNCAFNLTQ